ncbi:alpha/beta-hydrolase [Earliella scabrosa]|nr:alpha/beta-hydrolase [Earliella scabrosa]
MLSRRTVLFQIALVLGGLSSLRYSFRAEAATVHLDKATVLGATNDSVTSYLGIPFAHPPIGNLRFRLPKPIESYDGKIDATGPATQCLQPAVSIRQDMPEQMLRDMTEYFAKLVSSAGGDAPYGEDCLTINVQVPEGTKPGDKLPVLAFIFGGGFAVGSTALNPGDALVRRSIELNQPVLFAAMNYRVNVFGFLGGREVSEAGVGNIGLHDQREGLRWIKKHIAAFGGDPDKVTLWGASAGAVSVALQMVTNGGNTEGLFRGAIMSAGSPPPTGHIADHQSTYDAVVQEVGCASAADTLECLRHVSADTLLAAATSQPFIFDYPGLAMIWAPRADGVFLKAPPQHLVLNGSVASIPFISGGALDEGTIFATGSFNISSEDEFREYVNDLWFPRAPRVALSPIFDLYPNDPAQGSPFGTGDANQLAPMYKRMSAFQGDTVFQAPRRFFQDHRSGQQPIWSYMNARGCLAGVGCAHATDFTPALFEPTELTDYMIQFIGTLDPNGASDRTVEWPKYDTQSRQILSIVDGGLEIGTDTFRQDPMEALTALSLVYPM